MNVRRQQRGLTFVLCLALVRNCTWPCAGAHPQTKSPIPMTCERVNDTPWRLSREAGFFLYNLLLKVHDCVCVLTYSVLKTRAEQSVPQQAFAPLR